jgi:signal transduction histidine kinase
MKEAKWFIHPVFVFILSTLALAISLFLYIYWYIGVSAKLKSVIARYQLDASQFFEAQTWVVILSMSLLVGVILTGILLIFIFNLKTLQLYRLQHTFINNFTHELKTPVTSMKLYLETFAKYEIKREEQLKYIRFMLQDADRLSGNINNILNLARIEGRLYEGETTQVDIENTIRQFIDHNLHLFREADIVVTNLSERTITYRIVNPLFEILLMNILTNALKYNTSGRPQIQITLEQNQQSLLIHFKDNGIGMTDEEKKMVFRKFYQGRRDERIPAGGCGIGLYLVHQIVKLLHGQVFAESEGTGKGAILTVILPRSESSNEP